MKILFSLLILVSLTACTQKQTLNGLLPGGASSSSSSGTPLTSPTPIPTSSPTPSPTPNPTTTPVPTPTSQPTASSNSGVTWQDTTVFKKPLYYPIAEPDPNSVSNTYFVDMSSGTANATCSSSQPCKDICTSVVGKPGTKGGPAYIYLRGNGRLVLNCNLYGSQGNPVIIAPWPGATSNVTMTNDGSCEVPGANQIGSPGTTPTATTGVNYVIVDGGPHQLFKFVGARCTNDQNGYVVTMSCSNCTLARSEITQNGGGPNLGLAIGGSGNSSNPAMYTNEYVINTEIHLNQVASGAAYAVYAGGGTGCNNGDTAYNGIYMYNNLTYNICDQTWQFEPRSTGTNMIFSGNAFHDVSNYACGDKTGGAFAMASACGSSLSNITITNNLMFNLGGGGVDLGDTFPNTLIANNTIYHYAMATADLQTGSHGITCYSDGCKANVYNNIIVGAVGSGILPLNRASGFTTSGNMCDQSGDCGSSGYTGVSASSIWQSTTPGSNFLILNSAGPAIGKGLNLYNNNFLGGGLKLDYFQVPYPTSGPFNLGASQ